MSCEKPACKRCTYWRRRARHYSVAVMTRVATGHEYAGRSPGTLIAPVLRNTVGALRSSIRRWRSRIRITGERQPVAAGSRLGVIKYNAYPTIRVADPVRMEMHSTRGPQFAAAGSRLGVTNCNVCLPSKDVTMINLMPSGPYRGSDGLSAQVANIFVTHLRDIRTQHTL